MLHFNELIGSKGQLSSSYDFLSLHDHQSYGVSVEEGWAGIFMMTSKSVID